MGVLNNLTVCTDLDPQVQTLKRVLASYPVGGCG